MPLSNVSNIFLLPPVIMQNLRPLDNPADIDFKEELAHIDKPGDAYIERDPRLAGLADELAWAHGLSEDELALESKKLLRKVDWRLMPTLFIVSQQL